jgi:hypothetical protein
VCAPSRSHDQSPDRTPLGPQVTRAGIAPTARSTMTNPSRGNCDPVRVRAGLRVRGRARGLPRGREFSPLRFRAQPELTGLTRARSRSHLNVRRADGSCSTWSSHCRTRTLSASTLPARPRAPITDSACPTHTSDWYYRRDYICFVCDREWTHRESIPIEIAGLLFDNDQCWLRWRDGGTPGLT